MECCLENVEVKMTKKITLLTLAAAMALSVTFVAGCESNAQTGTAIGGLAGAGIGQLAGGSTEATLIGAAVGAGAGYILGNEGDKKDAAANVNTLRAEQNTVTVWITNSNRSKVPVRLTKSGPNYVGPRGEIYSTLPTEDQLRPVYGF